MKKVHICNWNGAYTVGMALSDFCLVHTCQEPVQPGCQVDINQAGYVTLETINIEEEKIPESLTRVIEYIEEVIDRNPFDENGAEAYYASIPALLDQTLVYAKLVGITSEFREEFTQVVTKAYGKQWEDVGYNNPGRLRDWVIDPYTWDWDEITTYQGLEDIQDVK